MRAHTSVIAERARAADCGCGRYHGSATSTGRFGLRSPKRYALLEKPRKSRRSINTRRETSNLYPRVGSQPGTNSAGTEGSVGSPGCIVRLRAAFCHIGVLLRGGRIRIGDTVQLRSGGAAMTVTAMNRVAFASGRLATCQWFVENFGLAQEMFPESALTVRSTQGKTAPPSAYRHK